MALYKVLGYNEYRNFLPAAGRKAWTACTESGQNPEDHFVVMHDMVKIGSGAQAQTYYAIQTRRAEILLGFILAIIAFF